MTEPFYFGVASRRLFGVYHAPDAGVPRNAGVVLCYPMGQEYLRVHRPFRQLAGLLARYGFHVLRFDFSCCGDSAGDSRQGNPESWIDDVSTAVDELGSGGVQRTGLVGLRLGATLAMMSAAKRADIEAMVLWEPVITGRRYVRELRRAHRTWLCGSFARLRPDRGTGPAGEALGFPLTTSLRGELERIDALTLDRKPADKVLIIETGHRRESRCLCEHLSLLGARAHCERISGPELWVKQESDNSRSPAPPALVQRIAGWIAEVL